jgi:hypothetical protein
MKVRTFATFFALFLLSFATPSLTSAQTTAASGTYKFSFEDGSTKYVEFDARTQADGSTVGQMFLSDEATLSYQDVDGADDSRDSYNGFYVKADFDGLTVNNNQAVMSGIVRDSSVQDLVGRRVLLTVEDNGDNTRVPDKVTWGLYKPVERNWTPSDAELREDPGVGLRWTATDAERRDDAGIEMPRDESINTKTFPIATYAFVDTENGAGDIRVQP